MDKAGNIRVAETRDLEGPERLRWTSPFPAGLLLAGVITVVLVGLIAGFEMIHANAVFPGVRVGEISVGGMTKERALAELRPLFNDRAGQPLAVRAVGMEQVVSASSLGATFDAGAAVDAAYAVGRTGGWGNRLAEQMEALLKGYSVEAPGIQVDLPKLQSYVAQWGRQVDRPVKDAELVIGDDLSVRVTPSVVGRKLDATKAVTELERAIVTGAPSVDLPVTETQPGRTEKDLEAARVTLSRMLSGPVALEFEGKRWSLSQKEIAALVTVDQRAGIPTPAVSLNEQPLAQMVDRIAAEIDQPKMYARYDWNGGNLKLLRQGQDGRKVDRTRALASLKDAISGDQRVVALPVEIDRAAGMVADPAQLGIKEPIEFGRTTITGVPEKQHNIRLAASRLNGVLLAPGDLFSFNRELGPTTLKSGYQTGFGISVTNGQMETVPSVAGGICQVATTLLHAVFRAGYQIEERYPHLYWIPNYGLPPSGMVGLDATVDDPNLDLKFVNNTNNYLLIQASIEGNTLQFTLYGTKPDWKVDIEGPIITNVVKADPRTVRQEEPSWPEGRELWVESATDGMDVDIIRRVTQGGETRTLHLKSHYLPSRNVLMVGTKKPEPAPSASAATGTPSPAPHGTPAPSATPGPTSTAVPSKPPAPQATATPGGSPPATQSRTPAPRSH